MKKTMLMTVACFMLPSTVFATSYGVECQENISLSKVVSSRWINNCLSHHQDDGGWRDPYNARPVYARYFTFTLDKPEEINVEVTAQGDTYFYLLEGHGEYGQVLGNYRGKDNTISLQAGQYTIELATRDQLLSEPFTLLLNSMEENASCINPLDINSVMQGHWSANCLIQNFNVSNNDPYAPLNPERANYYSFSVSKETDFRLENLGDYNKSAPLFNLYRDNDLSQKVDSNSDGFSWSRTSDTLDFRLIPGVYTLEVTAHNRIALGNYRFKLSAYPVSSCLTHMSIGQTLGGLLSDGCYSQFRETGYYDPYNSIDRSDFNAKQFEFKLEKPTAVRVNTFFSNNSAYVYLAKKESGRLVLLGETFDESYSTGLSREMVRTLDTGVYVLDVTTRNPHLSGQFDLVLSEADSEPCHGLIGVNSALSGELDNHSNCASSLRVDESYYDPYNPISLKQFYAKTYSFKINHAGHYRLEASSSDFAMFMTLVKGPNSRGIKLLQKQSQRHDSNQVSQWLEPGYYTVELTTLNAYEFGSFVLKLSELCKEVDSKELHCSGEGYVDPYNFGNGNLDPYNKGSVDKGGYSDPYSPVDVYQDPYGSYFDPYRSNVDPFDLGNGNLDPYKVSIDTGYSDSYSPVDVYQDPYGSYFDPYRGNVDLYNLGNGNLDPYIGLTGNGYNDSYSPQDSYGGYHNSDYLGNTYSDLYSIRVH
ncbi:hypothetical protein [Zooshikella harenae]|uniref:Peptidase C-terminal archaeal/bacterial domain-containing protein n=1 Tax=Zooshikella harenae TaxID=2827238 RepID=A0ABS5ZEN9_9GAMM|nr:hypothetical protein [Zooshikella harenae]MBU2712203.1 hypothetical protein [Zooshikella harenae]